MLTLIQLKWFGASLSVTFQKKTLFTKEDLVGSIEEFWATHMTVEQCTTYIDHVFKVVPVCLLMNGQATGSMPDRLFRKEPSRGKNIRYFQDLLWSPAYDVQRRMCRV